MKIRPSAHFAVTFRLSYPHEPGWIARISSTIARQAGVIATIDLVEIHKGRSLRDYTVECASTEHAEQLLEALQAIPDLEIREVSDKTFLLHRGGKLAINPRMPIKTHADISMLYKPGVARVCRAIHADPSKSFALTLRHNTVALVSDGSAVPGLGDIGPEAVLPLLEGRALLLKEFAGVDAFPLCVSNLAGQAVGGTAPPDAGDIVNFCKQIAPTFGAIFVSDLATERSFASQGRLQSQVPVPVLLEHTHGTAAVVLAGLINALKITQKDAASLKVVIAGAGAASVACAKALVQYGVLDLVVCDTRGAIYAGRNVSSLPHKRWLAENTNPARKSGTLQDVLVGADMFLGVSCSAHLEAEDIDRMAPAPIVFALGNPVPEVDPDAVHDRVAVLATARGDWPNEVDDFQVLPGILRGVLDARAHTVNDAMMKAAAEALAASIPAAELLPDYVLPSALNRETYRAIAAAVASAAHSSGVGHSLQGKSRIERF